MPGYESLSFTDLRTTKSKCVPKAKNHCIRVIERGGLLRSHAIYPEYASTTYQSAMTNILKKCLEIWQMPRQQFDSQVARKNG